MRSRRLLSLLSLAITAGGCATVGMVRDLPPDDGRAFAYAASLDTLILAAQTALVRRHVAVTEVAQPDSSTRVLIGRTRVSFWRAPSFVRVRVTQDSGDRASVRILSRPVQLTDPFSRDQSPRMFEALDRQLGREAIGPFPGQRIEVLAPRAGRPVVRGTLRRVTLDSLELSTESWTDQRSGVVLPLAQVDQLAVSRGSYGHAREGYSFGALLGLGVAFNPTVTSTPEAAVLILLVGSLVGAAAGSSIRTEVWSLIPPSRR